MHRKLLELVYYLPFGYKAEYFYCMMSYLLPEDCFYLMPNRITKPVLEIRAEREDKKAKDTELEQTAEEKQAGEYRCNIARMIYDIESPDTIESIYSFIIGLLSVLISSHKAIIEKVINQINNTFSISLSEKFFVIAYLCSVKIKIIMPRMLCFPLCKCLLCFSGGHVLS